MKAICADRQISPSESGSIAGTNAGVALLLGAEGQGLSEESKASCQAVTIPMPGDMESLNASHAGAILMFMLSDQWPILAQRIDKIAGPSACHWPLESRDC